MASVQVRISEHTHDEIKALANELGESMQSVMDKAVERYKREIFLEHLNRDFEQLRKNKESWDSELEERELWDATLSDGVGN